MTVAVRRHHRPSLFLRQRCLFRSYSDNPWRNKVTWILTGTSLGSTQAAAMSPTRCGLEISVAAISTKCSLTTLQSLCKDVRFSFSLPRVSPWPSRGSSLQYLGFDFGREGVAVTTDSFQVAPQWFLYTEPPTASLTN